MFPLIPIIFFVISDNTLFPMGLSTPYFPMGGIFNVRSSSSPYTIFLGAPKSLSYDLTPNDLNDLEANVTDNFQVQCGAEDYGNPEAKLVWQRRMTNNNFQQVLYFTERSEYILGFLHGWGGRDLKHPA